MNKLGFSRKVKAVKNNKCPLCHKEIKMSDFRNCLSIDEYNNSGLCQECQDKMFGKD